MYGVFADVTTNDVVCYFGHRTTAVMMYDQGLGHKGLESDPHGKINIPQLVVSGFWKSLGKSHRPSDQSMTPPVTIYRWGRTCILQPAGNQNNGCEVSYACHRAKATCLQCQPTREYTFSLAASCRQLDSRLRGQGSLEPGRTANTPRSLSLLKLNMIYMPAHILSDVCWPLSKLMLAYFYI